MADQNTTPDLNQNNQDPSQNNQDPAQNNQDSDQNNQDSDQNNQEKDENSVVVENEDTLPKLRKFSMDDQGDQDDNIPTVQQLKLSELGNKLVKATNIPSIVESINYLETKSSRPTQGVFYEWGRILDSTKLPEEFKRLKPGRKSLPHTVGGINVLSVLRNEHMYINKILVIAYKVGYRTAWIQKDGIIFYVNYHQMLPKSRSLFDEYYLNQFQLIQMMGPHISVCIKYPHMYDDHDIQLMGYELSLHYRNMGCRSTIHIDHTDIDNPCTILTIHNNQPIQPIQLIQPNLHNHQYEPQPPPQVQINNNVLPSVYQLPTYITSTTLSASEINLLNLMNSIVINQQMNELQQTTNTNTNYNI